MDIFRYIIYRYTKFIKAHPKLIRREHGKDEGWWMAWVPTSGINPIAFALILYMMTILVVLLKRDGFSRFGWPLGIVIVACIICLDIYFERRTKDKKEFRESKIMYEDDPHYELKGWLVSLYFALSIPVFLITALIYLPAYCN